MNKPHGWLIISLSAVGAFIIDRITKWYAVQHVDMTAEIIPSLLYWQFHLNTAMALSLPLIPIIYYSLLVIVGLGLIVIWIKTMQQRDWQEFGFITFILVGAISNALDRWFYKGVIDFIAVPQWSVFNLADVYIVVAISFWFVWSLRKNHAEKEISKAA